MVFGCVTIRVLDKATLAGEDAREPSGQSGCYNIEIIGYSSYHWQARTPAVDEDVDPP